MQLNDLSSPLSLLLTRRSVKARDLVGPGPNADQIRTILTAAMRVPDHGKLAPWRFMIIDSDQRKRFATLLIDAYRAEKPDAGRVEIDAITSFAHQAPALIIVLSKPVTDTKVPVWEQELSAGAACQNLLMASHALGFAGCWLTGWAAYSGAVRDAFGSPNERIAGFMFLGSRERENEERPRPDYAMIVNHW